MLTRTRFAAVVVAAPLLLGACGGDSTTTSSTSSSAAAGATSGSSAAAPADAKPGDAKPGDARPGERVDKNAFLDAVNKGTADAKTYALTMTMDISGQQSGSMTMDGIADVSNQASPRLKMNMTLPSTGASSSGGTMEIILVDKMMYMKMPGSAGKYFKLSMAEMAKLTGQDLTQAMNPTAQLDKMKSAVKSVTYVGDEDVKGTRTRHYKAVIDGRNLPGMPTGSLASSASVPAELPYELWLDDANRTRKFTMEMATGGQSMKYQGSMDKFGEPVTIQAPPASQTQAFPNQASATASK